MCETVRMCAPVQRILQTETERLGFCKVITDHLHGPWPLGAQALTSARSENCCCSGAIREVGDFCRE